MIKIYYLIIFMSFLLSGCMKHTNYEEEISITEWLRSAAAKNGDIYLSGQVTPDYAANIIKQILELNKIDNIERIRLILNSEGGSANSSRAIINGINMSKKPVDTINIDICWSACVTIYASATGKKYAYPNASFLVHAGKYLKSYPGIEEILRFEDRIIENIIKENSNLPEEWFPLTSKTIYFSAKEAKQYNLVDEIITELPKTTLSFR